MPRIRLKGKTHTQKPRKVRIRVVTEKMIYKRAMATIRSLDAKIEANKAALRSNRAAVETKATTEIVLIKDGKPQREGIHEVTKGGVCHRPDLWFAGGQACDQCALYPWCLRDKKRLKDENSQPADKNAKYFRRLEAEESAYEISKPKRPRIVSATRKKRRIKIKR